jgi:hypothetical protein
VTADSDRGDAGAVKVGSLSKKFDVIVDPYFPRKLSLLADVEVASLRVVMCMHLMCRCRPHLRSSVLKTSCLARA